MNTRYSRKVLLVLVVVTVLFLSSCAKTNGSSKPTYMSLPLPTATKKPTLTLTPEPVTLLVNADGSGDVTSLEKALEMIPYNGTIQLGPGLFELPEMLRVSGKSVKLVGSGMEKTEIVSGVKTATVVLEGPGKFELHGITFRHQGKEMGYAVIIGGAEVAISNCRFSGAVFSESEGVTTAGLIVDNVTGVIEHSVASGNDKVGFFVTGNSNLTFEKNSASLNSYAGALFRNHTTVRLYDNVFSNNNYGLQLEDYSRITAVGNRFQNNEESAILMIEASNAFITQGSFVDNKIIAIAGQDTADLKLEQSTCSGSNLCLALTGNSTTSASDNQFEANGYGVVVIDSASIVLEDNSFKLSVNSEYLTTFGISSVSDTVGTIANNEINGFSAGIEIREAILDVSGNILKNNGVGIWINKNKGLVANPSSLIDELLSENKFLSNGVEDVFIGTFDDLLNR